jgi:hypothetical protein
MFDKPEAFVGRVGSLGQNVAIAQNGVQRQFGQFDASHGQKDAFVFRSAIFVQRVVRKAHGVERAIILVVAIVHHFKGGFFFAIF